MLNCHNPIQGGIMMAFVRNFLKLAGAGVTILAAAVIIGCPTDTTPPAGGGGGDGDGNGGGATAPAVPGNFDATASISETSTAPIVTLTWDLVSAATTYDVYRATTPDFDFADGDFTDEAIIANVDAPESGTTTDYVDRNVEAGQTYYYAVSARNDTGSSALTATEEVIVPSFMIAIDSNPEPIAEQNTVTAVMTIASLTATAVLEDDVLEDGSEPTVTYTIDSATPTTHPFEISGADLILPANASLDYETAPSYVLEISGAIAESPNLISNTITVTITVTNVDDENPEIGAIPTGITVEAETTTLSVDPLTITATDDLGYRRLGFPTPLSKRTLQ